MSNTKWFIIQSNGALNDVMKGKAPDGTYIVAEMLTHDDDGKLREFTVNGNGDLCIGRPVGRLIGIFNEPLDGDRIKSLHHVYDIPEGANYLIAPANI